MTEGQYSTLGLRFLRGRARHVLQFGPYIGLFISLSSFNSFFFFFSPSENHSIQLGLYVK